MAKIHAPNTGYGGTRHGVAFTRGVGETDDEQAIAYFRARGYGIDGPAPQRDAAEPADPRKVGFLGSGIDPQGTTLRDAAVDPRPGDFLPPSNAGEANPHGPEVVSPEIHGSQGMRPVKPGEVHVDDTDAQEAAETEHAEAAADGTPITDGQVDRPVKSASKADWVEYAVAQGMDRAEAEKATKANLVERYDQED